MGKPKKKPEQDSNEDQTRPESSDESDSFAGPEKDLDQLEIKLKILKSYMRKDAVSPNRITLQDIPTKKSTGKDPLSDKNRE